jgi:hypothetical protein
VPANRVEERFDVLEDLADQLTPVRQSRRRNSALLSVAKKLSAMALS